MTTIRIHDLRLRTVIGIHAWERKVKQDVVINVTIQYDAAKATESDTIAHAFDYKRLCKSIITKVEKSQFKLIERLAEDIVVIAQETSSLQSITVRVEKPRALRHADSVSVEVHYDFQE